MNNTYNNVQTLYSDDLFYKFDPTVSVGIATTTDTTNTIFLNTNNTNDMVEKIECNDVMIKGKSLNDTLDKINDRLLILQVNEKIEAEYQALKELGDKYRTLEKELIDKSKMWDILKK